MFTTVQALLPRYTHRLYRALSQRCSESDLLSTAVESADQAVDESATGRPPRKFKSFPFAYHEEIDLIIDDVTNLGLGVGRVSVGYGLDTRKWVVMVPSVIAGELVKVRIYRNFDKYSEADLVEVLTPSPQRILPRCRYFTACGGCQYQHMDIATQRQWKKAQVINVLQRIGEVPPEIVQTCIQDVQGTNQIYGYRSKLTPHFDAFKHINDLKIGFLARGSRKVVDVDECVIASDAVNQKYQATRDMLMKKYSQSPPPKKGVTLLFREALNGYVETDHRALISQTVNNVTFRYKAGEFFQNNPFVLPLMVDHVIHQASRRHCKYLVDAYCGSGLFALCAAHRFSAVYGVEVSEQAIQAAKENALSNQISNVMFICASSEQIFREIQHLSSVDTAVIIDPPRKGCDEIFLRQLFAFHPNTLVYVSCDPATQARDTKFILQNDYEIVDITPFDLFPQTRHIENVITFLSNRTR